MAEIVTMPKLGFDMKEGTLVRWIKNEGEKVSKGDILAEIETDKATVEVESPFSGVLFSQLVEKDAIVPIGDPIAVIAEKDEKIDLEPLLGKKPEPKSSKTESIEEKEEKTTEDKTTVTSEDDDGERIKVSPVARKMASENRINLVNVEGTGPGGRIIKKDIESVLDSKQKDTPQIVDVKPEAAKEKPVEEKPESGNPLPSAIWFADELKREENRKPLNKLRQAISRRMVDSKQNIPHFYVTKSIDVDPLMSVYKHVNETLPAQQKISINDYVIKATALTLHEFPNINATISDNELLQHGNVNIGVAVAVEGGLLTIVVKDADVKPLRVISQEVKEMAARVRSGKVRSEDVEGSTFSISNLGMFDVENFAAIINPPESAILAVSSARKEAVVIGDEIKISWRMKVTLSADHRATDGVEAAEFMKALAFQLENPMRLLL
ncbi:MAG: dihydrolipoamide acetyltransferase [Chloroflexi bacterium HGW-Chloroflexi-3]|nr:MAG: dihydrolipoamide acetyltransferase [Chloroflexi bacterium HGW-Chloroflexi-3]